MPIPDETYTAGIRAGDERAFEAMFRAYAEPLVKFVRAYLNDQDVAEDVVQEVFESIWERHEAWPAPTSLRAYLYTAAKRRAISRIRHDVVTRRTASDLRLHLAPNGEGTGRRHAADAPILNEELRDALDRALAQVPARSRQAFELRFIHELSYDEIGVVMAISPRTVSAHLVRAVALLRQMLTPLALSLLLLPMAPLT